MNDTTDDSSVLSMAFRRDIHPYSLESFQWPLSDNDPGYTIDVKVCRNQWLILFHYEMYYNSLESKVC